MFEPEKFSTLFEENGLKLPAGAYEKFEKYAELLVEWNEKINLTAIVDPDGILVKHFLDSVLILNFSEISKGAKIVDVGTGAGFPGIPLKILRDDLDLTLMDSLGKRINFLREVVEKCETKAECIHIRAEDAGKNPEYREKFDVAVARAVAPLPVLCEYCLPLVKVGGKFLSLKGISEDFSLAENAVKLLGGKFSFVKEYSLPNGDKRTLVEILKISQTPTKYPRNSAQIAKKSL
ncbi:MAG TPA: 16S rRNA (guanine(527)-N(7))-methyltransferase RsmG [Oscillospiraceae bacterium]|nr:16S rRNA (guanine(527)-N(7))-methyltransferase RsmG [Oscillospiraceae bacterium]